MFYTASKQWIRSCFPELPEQFHDEYIKLLLAYRPDAKHNESCWAMPPGSATWSFPFWNLPPHWDADEWEEWTLMVEADMSERYGFPISAWES